LIEAIELRADDGRGKIGGMVLSMMLKLDAAWSSCSWSLPPPLPVLLSGVLLSADTAAGDAATDIKCAIVVVVVVVVGVRGVSIPAVGALPPPVLVVDVKPLVVAVLVGVVAVLVVVEVLVVLVAGAPNDRLMPLDCAKPISRPALRSECSKPSLMPTTALSPTDNDVVESESDVSLRSIS